MILFSILYWGSAYTAGLLTMGIYSVLYFKRRDIYHLNVAIFNINMLIIVFSFFLFIILPPVTDKAGSVIQKILWISCASLTYTLPRWVMHNSVNKYFLALKKLFLGLSVTSVLLILFLELISNDDTVIILIISVMTLSIAVSMIYSVIEDFAKKSKIASLPLTIITLVFIPSLVILNFFPEFLNISQEVQIQFHILPGFYVLLCIYMLFDLKGHFWNKKINYASFTSSRGISPREKEVMDLIFSGDSYQVISDKLSISLSTVKTHISNIFRKTGTSNKVELIALIHKESS